MAKKSKKCQRNEEDSGKESAETDSPPTLFFIFSDGQETYAVAPEFVVEVVTGGSATPVPFTPDWIEGVVSVRGKIVPVIDLHGYFQLLTPREPDRGRLIVMTVNGTGFTLWSNQIEGVEPVTEEKLEEVPSTLPETLLACTQAQFRLSGRMVYAIDMEKFLNDSQEQVRRE